MQLIYFFDIFWEFNVSDIQKDSSSNRIICKLFYQGGCLGTKNLIHLHSVSGNNLGVSLGYKQGLDK